MKSYYRVMLGRKSIHASDCFSGGFIGTNYDMHHDLTGKLLDAWRDFNKAWIPVFLAQNPDKTKIGAGLACGAIWTVSKGLQKGDIVLCPDGAGAYRFGEVAGDYYYAAGQILPHRRPVRWLDSVVARSLMSEPLQNSTGSIGTVSDVSAHAPELEKLVGTVPFAATVIATSPEIEDPAAFAMEQHLEAFLVANWGQTALANDYAIFTEDGEIVGQQYRTDAGPIDILAISHDRKRILVVELKRGRATDVVVGQILRYMGYVKEQIAESNQVVEGAIIALNDDQKLRWALAAATNIAFYRYQISFKLTKA
ncbi:endonuclease NucS domain-containing protein [Achromobacter sp. NPDC058515]|uniref:endonuclease NucS domain-containing protein n=1 Tax=Achromobacter sp. NPDC058515 TaxID=3346533 RepID=UPI00364D26EB